MTPITEITHADMAPIALGGAFLGTGGGGDPYIGRLMAEQAIAKDGPVPVVDVDTLADDALVIPVAMMGAPTVMLEKLPRGDEAVAAVRALEAVLGRKADAIFCIEAGGLNSTIPIAVASTLGLPIVDGERLLGVVSDRDVLRAAGPSLGLTPYEEDAGPNVDRTLREIMSRMGHSSSDASLRYLKASERRDGEIADAIEGRDAKAAGAALARIAAYVSGLATGLLTQRAKT